MGDILDSYVYRSGIGNNVLPTLINPTGMFLIVRVVIWWTLLLFGSSALLMWLWNITITKIFSLRQIKFWESVRLVIIVWLLLGKAFDLLPLGAFFALF